MRADSSAMRSPSRSRSGGSWDCGGAALSCSASARVVVSLAPAAINPVVTVDVGCSAVENSGHPAGVAARGRVLVSGAMAAWYTRFSTPSCCPVSGPSIRFRRFGPNSGFGRPRARAEDGNESGIGRLAEVEESGAQYHVNPIEPVTSNFLHFFCTRPHSRVDRMVMDAVSCRPRNHDAGSKVRGRVDSTPTTRSVTARDFCSVG